jgi:hypothetical protein
MSDRLNQEIVAALEQLSNATNVDYRRLLEETERLVRRELQQAWRDERLGGAIEQLQRDFASEYIEQERQAKALRINDYRARRSSESSTAMHFARQRTPRREPRQHGDPLRHHRLRGFRRASRRDQTDIRTEAR